MKAPLTLFFCWPLLLFAQQFNWSQNGYMVDQGGGYFENVDGEGTNMTISVPENSNESLGMYLNDESLQIGINNHVAEQIQHTYTFEFSQPIDFQIQILGINEADEQGLCYNDQLTFSGEPNFFSHSQVDIDGNVVYPQGLAPYYEGEITVFWEQVDLVSIQHGAGVYCNPGYIIILPLKFAIPSATSEIKTQNLSIFPNPASSLLQIKCEPNDVHDIKIVDISGKEHPIYWTNHGDELHLEVEDLPRGFYHLLINNKNLRVINESVFLR